MDDLYSKPVFQTPNRACFLQNSRGAGGLEGGGAESVGWGSQAGFSPSSLRASLILSSAPQITSSEAIGPV